MEIRAEAENDRALVRELNVVAFEGSAEADLVDGLRQNASPIISLVAEEEGQIVGHILFSPAGLIGHPEARIMGLAPMAVLPEHQNKGIGSALVRAGLEQCRNLGFAAVIVLGHPEYYPRFGFKPASRFNLESEYDVPDEVFMAIELEPGALSDLCGRAQYHEAFYSLG